VIVRKRVGHSRPKTYGPVPDLECHVRRDWWRWLFNSLYLKTDGDVVENHENTAREVDLLMQMAGLHPADAILDLCCGQGRHCLELARRGFSRVTGLDQSRYLIGLASRRARREGLDIAFHQGDARRLRFPDASFDCVILAGNSFGYFDAENDDRAVLQGARRVLRSGGRLALDLSDGEWIRDHFEPRSWEWISKAAFVCRERSLSSDGSRLVCREVVTDARRGVIADQFYAVRLYSRRKLCQMLEQAGFPTVREHGAVATDSWRNQDLGMMAQRFFITAYTGERETDGRA